MVPVGQIHMILVKKKNSNVLDFELLPRPDAWTQVSEVVKWKPAMNGTNCLNMNAF